MPQWGHMFCIERLVEKSGRMFFEDGLSKKIQLFKCGNQRKQMMKETYGTLKELGSQ